MPKKRYECANCGTVFWDYESNRRNSKTGCHCCSRKCKGEYQVRLAEEAAPTGKTESLCAKCGLIKPLSEFYRDKRCRANGGIQYVCKECIKVQRKAYYDANREKVISRVHRYARKHPEIARKHSRRQRSQQSLEEKHAWAKLNRELEAGRIRRPDCCEMCGRHRKLHAHHYLGYAPEHALDVKWVCVRCHHELHGRGPNCREEEIA